LYVPSCWRSDLAASVGGLRQSALLLTAMGKRSRGARRLSKTWHVGKVNLAVPAPKSPGRAVYFRRRWTCVDELGQGMSETLRYSTLPISSRQRTLSPRATRIGVELETLTKDDSCITDHFLPLAYPELRKLAAQKLANERWGHTLQPTALVHEAYLRLIARSADERWQEPKWQSHAHFFAAAAEAMRRILVENARRKSRLKHGGGRQRVGLVNLDISVCPPQNDIVALDEALTRLATDDPEAARVVELHFFGGLSIEQVAATIGVSRATAYRQWTYARAWLGCAMGV